MKRVLIWGAVLGAFACAPAFAQPEFTTKPKPDVPPPPGMSCDDVMTNAELKLQTVIDADKKAVAMAHMDAAEAAITKNDPDGCKAQVQQALDAVK
jgi:hypothetical protein